VYFLIFQVESNGEKLYTPQNSQAFTDRTYVNIIYGFDNRETAVFITDPKTSGANILTKPALLAFLDLFNSLARSVPKPYSLQPLSEYSIGSFAIFQCSKGFLDYLGWTR
jgi:hypothetical protein